jgi:hypothetical protein
MYLTHLFFLLVSTVSAHPEPHCIVNSFLAGQYVDGPIDMGLDPVLPFDAPKLSALNSTAIED